jgi:hypothetical protein
MVAAMVAAAFVSTHVIAPRPRQMVPPNSNNQVSSSAADDSYINNKSAAITSSNIINPSTAAAYNSNKSVATMTADSKRSITTCQV